MIGGLERMSELMILAEEDEEAFAASGAKLDVVAVDVEAVGEKAQLRVECRSRLVGARD